MKGCGKNDCGRLKGYYPNGDTWYCRECEARLDELEKSRQEAIKWIKNCEWRGFSITACTDTDRCIACIRTMKMNNIIEGDLE